MIERPYLTTVSAVYSGSGSLFCRPGDEADELPNNAKIHSGEWEAVTKTTKFAEEGQLSYKAVFRTGSRGNAVKELLRTHSHFARALELERKAR